MKWPLTPRVAGAMRGSKPIAVYAQEAGLEGGPMSIEEMMHIASSLIVDVLHTVEVMRPSECLPLTVDGIEDERMLNDGSMRALEAMNRAIETFMEESAKR